MWCSALWSKDALRGLSVFEQLPGYVELGIDARTLGFAALLSVVTAFVFGIAPAIAGARLQPGATLKGMRGRGAQWLSPGRGVLVSVQVALAMLLTVASGLMLRSLSKQLDIDPAFRSDGVYTLRVQLPARRYDGDAALGYSRQLEERVGALPGVLSVAMSSDVPLVDGYSARSTRIEDWLSDRPDDTVRAYHHAVSPGFFSTLDIDLSAGRDFSWFDNREAPRVVVVSRKMAERSWPGENPLGKRISFSDSDGPWRSVVGVVEDIRYRNLVADTVSTSDDPDVYSPLAQEPTRNLGIVIDASGTTVSLESVRAEIRAMDAAIPVYAVRAMADVLDEQLALPRFAASLLGLFGGVALLLAVRAACTACSPISSRSARGRSASRWRSARPGHRSAAASSVRDSCFPGRESFSGSPRPLLSGVFSKVGSSKSRERILGRSQPPGFSSSPSRSWPLIFPRGAPPVSTLWWPCGNSRRRSGSTKRRRRVLDGKGYLVYSK